MDSKSKNPKKPPLLIPGRGTWLARGSAWGGVTHHGCQTRLSLFLSLELCVVIPCSSLAWHARTHNIGCACCEARVLNGMPRLPQWKHACVSAPSAGAGRVRTRTSRLALAGGLGRDQAGRACAPSTMFACVVPAQPGSAWRHKACCLWMRRRVCVRMHEVLPRASLDWLQTSPDSRLLLCACGAFWMPGLVRTCAAAANLRAARAAGVAGTSRPPTVEPAQCTDAAALAAALTLCLALHTLPGEAVRTRGLHINRFI